jgi:hypothetical protein
MNGAPFFIHGRVFRQGNGFRANSARVGEMRKTLCSEQFAQRDSSAHRTVPFLLGGWYGRPHSRICSILNTFVEALETVKKVIDEA